MTLGTPTIDAGHIATESQDVVVRVRKGAGHAQPENHRREARPHESTDAANAGEKSNHTGERRSKRGGAKLQPESMKVLPPARESKKRRTAIPCETSTPEQPPSPRPTRKANRVAFATEALPSAARTDQSTVDLHSRSVRAGTKSKRAFVGAKPTPTSPAAGGVHSVCENQLSADPTGTNDERAILVEPSIQTTPAQDPVGDGAIVGSTPIQSEPLANPDPYATIRLLVQQRNTLLKMRTACTNTVGAYVRTMLGWRFDLPKADSDAIKKQAARMLGAKDGANASVVSPHILAVVSVLRQTEKPITAQLKVLEGSIRECVAALPVWPWCKTVRGLAELSVANILAITGDLAKWQNPAKVWKRMGLAPPSAIPEDWKRPHARAVMWVVGDNLIRSKNAEYRKLYDDRKAITCDRIGSDEKPWSKLRRHRDAHRIMEKELLLNFWKAFR